MFQKYQLSFNSRRTTPYTTTERTKPNGLVRAPSVPFTFLTMSFVALPTFTLSDSQGCLSKVLPLFTS